MQCRFLFPLVVVLMGGAPGCGGSGGGAPDGGGAATDATLAPGSNPSGGAAGSITAQFDGVPWSGNLIQRVTLTANILSITGEAPSFEVLTMALPGATQAGTFSLAFAAGGGGLANIIDGTKSWTTASQGGDGSVTLTDISDTHVAGTFQFTAVGASGVTHVTAGQFDLPRK